MCTSNKACSGYTFTDGVCTLYYTGWNMYTKNYVSGLHSTGSPDSIKCYVKDINCVCVTQTLSIGMLHTPVISF